MDVHQEVERLYYTCAFGAFENEMRKHRLLSLSLFLVVEREGERDREVGGTKGIQEKKRAEEFWPFANGILPRFFLAYNANPSTLGPNNSVEPVRPTWKRDTYATRSLSLSRFQALVSLFATPVHSPPAFSRLCSCPLQFLRYAIWNLQVLGQGHRRRALLLVKWGEW